MRNSTDLGLPIRVNQMQQKKKKILNEYVPGYLCTKTTDLQAKKIKSSRLEVKISMLVDPHMLYTKKIGNDDERIRHALLYQL